MHRKIVVWSNFPFCQTLEFSFIIPQEIIAWIPFSDVGKSSRIQISDYKIFQWWIEPYCSNRYGYLVRLADMNISVRALKLWHGPLCRRSLWEKGGDVKLMGSFLFSFNSNHPGNHQHHIHFGLLLVYKGNCFKGWCPRIQAGLITQSYGFDVFVPNLLPGSMYLGTMVIECHWNT